MLEMFKHKPSLSKVKRGMSAEEVREALSDCRIVVEDCGLGLEIWEVWYKDGRLSYPAAEICVDKGKVNSIDEYACRPFSGDAVDFAESLFQALASLAPSSKEEKLIANARIVLAKPSPPEVQQTDMGIWVGEVGIGIHVVIYDQKTRKLVLKKCR